jgi:hypothetical protein
MRGLLLLIVPAVLGAHEIAVKWSGGVRDTLNISVQAPDQFISQCLDSGLELKYRFHVRWCRRRVGWFDACEREFMEDHHVRFDPIAQQYTLVFDTHRDVEQPKTMLASSSKEAFDAVSSLRALKLSKLPGAASGKYDSKRSYVEVRVTAECKVEGNDILADIPYILSFGLINPSFSDSGWLAFQLADAEPRTDSR